MTPDTLFDDSGIVAWPGSLITVMDKESAKILTGILCTFDTLKRDAEIKLLIGCSAEDIQIIRELYHEMNRLYIPNPTAENDFPNGFS